MLSQNFNVFTAKSVDNSLNFESFIFINGLSVKYFAYAKCEVIIIIVKYLASLDVK